MSSALSPPLSDVADRIKSYTANHSPRESYYYQTEMAGLTFMRAEAPSGPLHSLYATSICVTLQGAKRVALGETVLEYEVGEYLVVGVEAPAVGYVVRASAADPYLGLKLALDVSLLLDLVSEVDVPTGGPGTAAFVGRLSLEAAGAIRRLVGLIDSPEAIKVLYPAFARELGYRLLSGPDGAAFARLAMPDGHARRVARAIDHMKIRFPQPVRVDDLAAQANMSPSSLHNHFKRLTGLSPLRYYKRLRLLEARRVLTSEGTSAQDAAYRAGYQSPSQFSREYARAFKVTPGQDAQQPKRQ